MRAPHVALVVTVLALVSTVWLPFVNTPVLWFGLPSVMVWTALWVLALSASLGWLEFSGRHPDDDVDWTEAVPPPVEQPEVHL